MWTQLLLGTVVTLASVIVATVMWGMLNLILTRMAKLAHRPHGGLRVVLVISVIVVFAMAIVMIGVWLWALVFLRFAVFDTLEEGVYYSLVAFTTLGLGDVVVPFEWRLLGGMVGANGFLIFGLITAMLTDGMRGAIRDREWRR